jgi:ATP-dependent exoDNAse (exonuclease V) beta subunit
MTDTFAFQDFAVLVRNTEVIGEFTAAFEAVNIPYVVNRGRGFYKSRQVLDLAHLLRVIANPLDEISLAVVLRSPLVGATDEDLLRLKMTSGSLAGGLSVCEGHAVLTPFRDRLGEWRARREYVTFDRLLAAAIDDCAYPLSPNVDKFLGQARAAAAHMSLDEFVAELALVREEDPREADAPPEDTSDTVKIMTVHSAKGLEFPVVVVAAMHKGVDSNAPVIGFSRHVGLGARWRNPATGRDKADIYLHALSEELKQREEAEASRLLYVAMTRAEKHLLLSLSHTDRKPSRWDKAVMEAFDIHPDTFASLETYSWPGNLRQLENVMQRPLVNVGGRARGVQHDAARAVRDHPRFQRGGHRGAVGNEAAITLDVDHHRVELGAPEEVEDALADALVGHAVVGEVGRPDGMRRQRHRGLALVERHPALQIAWQLHEYGVVHAHQADGEVPVRIRTADHRPGVHHRPQRAPAAAEQRT